MALRIVARTREEKTLDAITGLMIYLGSLREARKVFIVFSGVAVLQSGPVEAQTFLAGRWEECRPWASARVGADHDGGGGARAWPIGPAAAPN